MFDARARAPVLLPHPSRPPPRTRLSFPPRVLSLHLLLPLRVLYCAVRYPATPVRLSGTECGVWGSERGTDRTRVVLCGAYGLREWY
eukprot:3127863-Rhodomonas_salina.2